MDKSSLLKQLKDHVQPELVRQLEGALPGEFALADNQNQNQGGLEEMATMKPEILRNLGMGFTRAEGVADDNQNQNQGKLEDLLNMKPAALENVRRVLLAPGEEVMDNQNQNQGTTPTLARRGGKPA
jgi:hypothetical protein